MDIGKRIQQARKEKNKTQSQLGKLIGVSGAMIGQWENNLRKPKPETLKRIANALDISIGELWDGDDGNYIFNKKNINELGSFKTAVVIIKKGEIEFVLGSNNRDNGSIDVAQSVVHSLYELNGWGQNKVVEYAHELTKDPKYQRASPLKQFPDENLTNPE